MKKLLFWKKMFAVVLRVLRTAFGFILLNSLVIIMSFCIISCVLCVLFLFMLHFAY